MDKLQNTELFDIVKEKLYAAVICDTLDNLGYRNQAMRENIRPLQPNLTVKMIGWAKTILAVDVYHILDNPYAMDIEAVDSIKPNEIVVGGTNKSTQNGLWGELMSTASKMRGANGAIIDGLVRDSRQIAELGFTVYCTGTKPVDSMGRGQVIDYDCPVEAGGVMVYPNDVVFADCDGIVVIPSSIFEQTVQLALIKAESENHTRRELLEGKLLREVYDKYGVL